MLTITEYLNKKGIYSERDNGNTAAYKSPFYDDNTPSFYVWTNSDGREGFYCHGTKIKGNIITLICELENKSVPDAYRSIGLEQTSESSKGISIDNVICSIEKIAVNLSLPEKKENYNSLNMLYLTIGMAAKNPKSREKLAKLISVIDKSFMEDGLNEIELHFEATMNLLSGEIKNEK